MRAVLLSDETTSHWLRENFVLSWEEVRPTGKVNIDFGNGHTLERTLVGNTCFVVMLSDGTIVDAMPGVYTPSDFRNQAEFALDLAKKAQESDDPVAGIRAGHRASANRLLGFGVTMRTKAFVEAPLLRSLGLSSADLRSRSRSSLLPSAVEDFDEDDLESFVSAVSNRIEDLSKTPASSRVLAGRGLGVIGAEEAPVRTPTPKQIVAADSHANVRYLRPAIHVLLSTPVQSQGMEQFTRTIFYDLLHIDIDDPYLGLKDLTIPGTDGGV